MKGILVTGGAIRLGADICKYLALEGYNIIVHYRSSKQQALNVVEACRQMNVSAEAIEGDFSTPKQTEEFIERYLLQFPSTIGLINNVGNYLVKGIASTTIKEFESLFQSNLYVPFMLSSALIPSLKKEKGAIINLGVSGLNGNRPYPYSSAYMIAKSGLLSYTKTLSLELAPFQVSVNMVSPGQLDFSVDYDSKKLTLLPQGRPGYGEEVARTVAFLMNKENRYITGQNLEVAGACRL